MYVDNILARLGLWILGGIYRIVSYVYSVFILMCSLNFGVLEGIVSGLIDTVEAVIMVLVVFKVGMALINYMLEPEKAMKDGTKLVANILITAALLIGRNFVFGVFNELSMMIMGNPTGYPYTTLSTVASVANAQDEGLIMRAVFGSGKTEDVGEYLAFSTVSLFVHDYNSPGTSDALKKAISTKEGYEFGKMSTLANKIDKEVEYVPFLGTAIGIFLIYSLVKSAIEIGIRMFKLLILQLLAPLAIITCVGDGLKSSTFQNFCKKYISVWIEAFTRMLTMLIAVVFVSKFFLNIGEFFGNLTDAKGLTKGLVTVLVVVAAFKFATDVPKFIDEVLGTKISSGNTKNFLGGLLGFGAGALAGFIGGVAGGGIGGGLAGLATGGFKGAASGSKGNNVAEFFKGQKEVGAGAKTAGQNIAAKGGLGNVILGNVPGVSSSIRNAQDQKLAKLKRRADALDAYDKSRANAIKDFKMGTNLYDKNGQSLGLTSNYYTNGVRDVKLGEDKDAYIEQLLQYDTDVISKQAALDAKIQSGGDSTQERIDLENAIASAKNRAGDYYDAVKNGVEDENSFVYSDVNTSGVDSSVVAHNRNDVKAKRQSYVNKLDANDVGRVGTGAINTKTEKQRIYAEQAKITNTDSYARTHGQNPNN